METLPKDILISIALNLDLPQIIQFCKTDKYHNNVICESRNFWNRKLLQDFGIVSKTPKEEYKTLFLDQNNEKLYDKFGITSDAPVKAYNILQEKYDQAYTIFEEYALDKEEFEQELISLIEDMSGDIENMDVYNYQLVNLIKYFIPNFQFEEKYWIAFNLLNSIKEINILLQEYSNDEEYLYMSYDE